MQWFDTKVILEEIISSTLLEYLGEMEYEHVCKRKKEKSLLFFSLKYFFCFVFITQFSRVLSWKNKSKPLGQQTLQSIFMTCTDLVRCVRGSGG